MMNIRNQMSALMPPGRNAKRSWTIFSPCSPRNASAKACAQIRMNIIIAVILVVACAVSRSTFQVSRPPMAATTIEPSAPIDAASDGAAIPAMIEPSTAPTRPTGGATTLNDFADKLALGDERALFLGEGGHHVRTDDAENKNIDDVNSGQHEAGDHRGREQRADRFIRECRRAGSGSGSAG